MPSSAFRRKAIVGASIIVPTSDITKRRRENRFKNHNSFISLLKKYKTRPRRRKDFARVRAFSAHKRLQFFHAALFPSAFRLSL